MAIRSTSRIGARIHPVFQLKAEFDVQAANIPILEFQYFPTLTARAGIDDTPK